MVSKKTGNFKIPDSLLKQLNECTGGGFILFSISENGTIDVDTSFDNEILEIGLWRAAQNISSGVDDAISDNMRDSSGDQPEE